MIRMRGITKVYTSGLIETHALRGLSLHVEQGEFVAVMGPSGSGKTTLLNVAGLLDSFGEGHYELDGTEVRQLGDRRMSRIRNRTIGFVFQSFNLIADLDVYENVELPLTYGCLPRSERRDRVEHVLSLTGLVARRRHLPAQLSGGQQQRVAIARALVGQPQLILADEPTGNLPTSAAHQILDLLANLHHQGTTVVMVTHSAELAQRADRRVHLLDGRVVDTTSMQLQPEGPLRLTEIGN